MPLHRGQAWLCNVVCVVCAAGLFKLALVNCFENQNSNYTDRWVIPDTTLLAPRDLYIYEV